MERLVRAFVAALLVLTLVVGVAAAEARTGGTIVVEEGETVEGGLQAFGGTVVVHGTVEGDLDAFAGSVLVTGTVTGDLNGFGGSVRIAGDVQGDVGAFGGDVVLEEGGSVGGELEAAGGNIVLDGAVAGNVRVGAEQVTVGETASVGGDLEYDAESATIASGATISGTTRQVDAIRGPQVPVVPRLPNWVGGLYGFLVNVLVGAVLLAAVPRFSAGVARQITEDPLPAGGVGLLVLVGSPVLLVLLAITIIGIPLAIVGAVLWGLGLWLGFVYGAFALGTWLYAYASDEPNRWYALLLGLAVVVLLDLVPFLGGLVSFLVLLLGLGALGMGVWAGIRGRRKKPAEEAPGGGETGGDVGEPAADS